MVTWRGGTGERHEKHSVFELVDQVSGRLQPKARLSRPTGSR
jgi:hypothetical protein